MDVGGKGGYEPKPFFAAVAWDAETVRHSELRLEVERRHKASDNSRPRYTTKRNVQL